MKKLTKILIMNFAILMLVGCLGNTNKEIVTDSPDNSSSVLKSSEQDQAENTSKSELEGSDTDDSEDISSEESVSSPSRKNLGNQDNTETLSQFSSEQIEYARVWLQLGPNQEIDELNVRHISAGEPLDPNDDTSVGYPEDVIQLTGSRIVDGIVTYSGNGDGTINVYNVPRRWYGGFSPTPDLDKDAIRKEMDEIIENTELVYIEPVHNEEIINLIEILKGHN